MCFRNLLYRLFHWNGDEHGVGAEIGVVGYEADQHAEGVGGRGVEFKAELRASAGPDRETAAAGFEHSRALHVAAVEEADADLPADGGVEHAGHADAGVPAVGFIEILRLHD